LAADQKYKPAINNLKDLEERKEQTKKRLRAELPSWFFCPITQEIMKDPVLCVDGNSYERTAIEEWFKTSKTSPLTNLPLKSKQIFSNFNLKQSIKLFADKIQHGTTDL
jgi:endonuclease/exonuclease/phosphatase (EEP) superfamily protein YafD